ncbi:hypothetical protein Tco_1314441 [Tanacetum coccineum]
MRLERKRWNLSCGWNSMPQWQELATVVMQFADDTELEYINKFHVSNLKKCHADEPLAVPLDGLHLDDKLHFVEEPLERMGHEVKRLKRS